jgi:phosphohistidine phosphatase
MLRLLLLRHAKTARESGGGDHDRPLTTRGEADSKRIGRYLADERLLPDLAIASDSRRTRQTLDLALASGNLNPQTRLDRTLYLAELNVVLHLVRHAPGRVRTLLVVGHAPGMGDVAQRLTGSGDPTALERISTTNPTAAQAVLDFQAERWTEIAEHSGRLHRFVTPASLGEGGADED